MTKTPPERLREAAMNLAKDPGRAECRIADALYPGLCDRFDCDPRDSCLIGVFESLASEVETGYVEIPSFGTYDGRSLFLETMAEMAGAKVAKVVRVNADSGRAESLKLVFEPPKDTLEDIEDEATVSPRVYCQNHGIEVDAMDCEECFTAMVSDLLRRQREVLESDAPEAEERTCENACTLYGDFICSKCGAKATWEPKYCPCCGAKVVPRTMAVNPGGRAALHR